MQIYIKYFLILLTIIFLIYSCSSNSINHLNKEIDNPKIIVETDIVQIPLLGEISKKNSEISGLCWYGNKLILLPQYPNGFGTDIAKIFYIERKSISNFICGSDTSAILPDYFSIDLADFEEHFSFGSGFESISINNNTVYFTIESINQGKTETILISGKIDSVIKTIVLDKNSLIKDPTKMFIYNISDESILYYDSLVIPIYEVYGKNLNQNPNVSVFDYNLNFIKKIDFPNIEYRITDVTSVDESGKFWAINYFYPGDNKKLNPALDSCIINYGIGKSHLNLDQVERLVEFQITQDRIVLVDKPPIYIKLIENVSRNWEGLARFNNEGFLIVTDTFPETIFGYFMTPKE